MWVKDYTKSFLLFKLTSCESCENTFVHTYSRTVSLCFPFPRSKPSNAKPIYEAKWRREERVSQTPKLCVCSEADGKSKRKTCNPQTHTDTHTHSLVPSQRIFLPLRTLHSNRLHFFVVSLHWPSAWLTLISFGGAVTKSRRKSKRLGQCTPVNHSICIFGMGTKLRRVGDNNFLFGSKRRTNE